jgi:hypothetical protein
MANVNLSLSGGTNAFAPGEQVRGVCAWDLDTMADAIEVRLFWHTAGKGTTDVAIAETVRLEAPGFRGQREFSFRLPEGPYSFSGKLISLAWGVECVVKPKGPSCRAEIVVSPTCREVVLHECSDGAQAADESA